ncbi:MAG: DUF4160 domain-containing protein, partial [Acidimicrobiia bacterium]
MYFSDHNPPHFHALYGSHQAQISIATLQPIAGGLPRRALKLAQQWAVLHRQELFENWTKAQSGQPLDMIEPLP